MGVIEASLERLPKVIDTRSRRLRLAARLARLLPPGFSGVVLRFYPAARAAREKPGFTARSSLADFWLRTDRTDWVANAFAVRGFFDLANAVIAGAVCRPGDTILEVGANIGTETLLFARLVGTGGRVVCFEPLPENVAILREQLALNGITNVDLRAAAVSDTPGSLRFLRPQEGMNFGEGRIVEAHEAVRGVIDVPAVVLDELFADGAFAAPRLVAIDVQGAELFVLRGARRLLTEARPFVIAEVEQSLLASHGLNGADIDRLLGQLGYRTWCIGKWGLRPSEPARDDGVNWLCVPDGDSPPGRAAARRIHVRLRRAMWMPLVRGLNPAVVPRRTG